MAKAAVKILSRTTSHKKKKCGTCGKLGHNARGCPRRLEIPIRSADARRARVTAILARTKASRLELDAAIAGADMTSLDGITSVAYPSGIAPKAKRHGPRSRRDEEDGDEIIAVPPRERPPMAPPVPYDKSAVLSLAASKRARNYICSQCGGLGHNIKKCPDLRTERAASWDAHLAAGP